MLMIDHFMVVGLKIERLEPHLPDFVANLIIFF